MKLQMNVNHFQSDFYLSGKNCYNEVMDGTGYGRDISGKLVHNFLLLSWTQPWYIVIRLATACSISVALILFYLIRLLFISMVTDGTAFFGERSLIRSSIFFSGYVMWRETTILGEFSHVISIINYMIVSSFNIVGNHFQSNETSALRKCLFL